MEAPRLINFSLIIVLKLINSELLTSEILYFISSLIFHGGVAIVTYLQLHHSLFRLLFSFGVNNDFKGDILMQNNIILFLNVGL